MGHTLGQRRTRAFIGYVSCIVAGGVSVLLVSAVQVVRQDRPVPALAWVFLALLVAGEVKPIKAVRRGGGSEVTTTWTFAFALLFVTDLPTTLVAVGVASAVGDLLTRKPLVRAAFNVAQIDIAMLLGGSIIATTTALPLGPTTPTGVLVVAALFVAASVTCVANNLMTGIVVALDGGVAVRRAFGTESVTLFFVADVMLLALAPVLVVVAQRSVWLLPLVLITVLAVYRSARAALEREREALHDTLTRLPNRRMLDQRLDDALEEAARAGTSVTVMVLDLDRFKPINDVFGHQVGDLLLQETAARLLTLREVDLVARLGGDEFAVLLSSDVDGAEVMAIGRRIAALVREPYRAMGFPLEVDCSVGVASSPHHGRDVGELMRSADAAMYRAKHEGEGVAVATVERSTAARGRLSLLTELGAAIDGAELRLHYQPKVDIHTGLVRGMEALVRWEHPVHGLIAPGEFVPMGENTDLIGPLTDYVLEEAAAQTAQLVDDGFDLRVAVNLAARSLQDQRLAGRVHAILDSVGLAPERLEVEITESTFMADVDRASHVLTELQGLGVRLSLDDFGTGYSSFERLITLPLHELKIDRSFVSRLCDDPQAAVVVDAMVKLGRQLGLDVVAEGVEDVATWLELRRLECTSAQGYLVAAPMPGPDFEAWLRARATHGRPLCEPGVPTSLPASLAASILPMRAALTPSRARPAPVTPTSTPAPAVGAAVAVAAS